MSTLSPAVKGAKDGEDPFINIEITEAGTRISVRTLPVILSNCAFLVCGICHRFNTSPAADDLVSEDSITKECNAMWTHMKSHSSEMADCKLEKKTFCQPLASVVLEKRHANRETMFKVYGEFCYLADQRISHPSNCAHEKCPGFFCGLCLYISDDHTKVINHQCEVSDNPIAENVEKCDIQSVRVFWKQNNAVPLRVSPSEALALLEDRLNNSDSKSLSTITASSSDAGARKHSPGDAIDKEQAKVRRTEQMPSVLSTHSQQVPSAPDGSWSGDSAAAAGFGAGMPWNGSAPTGHYAQSMHLQHGPGFGNGPAAGFGAGMPWNANAPSGPYAQLMHLHHDPSAPGFSNAPAAAGFGAGMPPMLSADAFAAWLLHMYPQPHRMPQQPSPPGAPPPLPLPPQAPSQQHQSIRQAPPVPPPPTPNQDSQVPAAALPHPQVQQQVNGVPSQTCLATFEKIMTENVDNCGHCAAYGINSAHTIDKCTSCKSPACFQCVDTDRNHDFKKCKIKKWAYGLCSLCYCPGEAHDRGSVGFKCPKQKTRFAWNLSMTLYNELRESQKFITAMDQMGISDQVAVLKSTDTFSEWLLSQTDPSTGKECFIHRFVVAFMT